RKPKPDLQFQLSLRLSMPVPAAQTASPVVSMNLIFQLSGTTEPAVVPLGLGQVNQLHDSYNDSPTANVLLVPSVMSRIEMVPPCRARDMTRVRVPASPNPFSRAIGKVRNGQYVLSSVWLSPKLP